MNQPRLKDKIFEYIKKHDGTTFVEIERIFDEYSFDYKGEGAYTSGSNEKVIFWIGWNQAAFNLIADLKQDALIKMSVCSPLIYMIDGKSLKLPIAKSKNIKTDHWLPVTFSINKEDIKNER
ncbi:pathogenicity island protein [Staphylococcus hominis]|uniref:pathogenicity island protein n=1 Tax=Staphylococcus hominis TaxID=1290 RepID=UPI0026DF61D3|nr:pathogenicity island protein [Staphylococcus hominis]MDS3872185.1 pathogenicity island protein [Staphylococcus hominis]